MTKFHEDELEVSEALAASLIQQQYPQYGEMPLVRLAASGSSNVQFRLGDDLLVRFPRQPGGGAAIAKEQRWSPMLQSHLQVAMPEIVGLGTASSGYPETWSIVRWIEGEHPPVMGASISFAHELADELLRLREIDTRVALETDPDLSKPYRGKPLGGYHPWMLRSIEACRAIPELDLDLDAVSDIWSRAMALPGVSDSPRQEHWYHSDIVAENLLMRDGQLTGLLDFGGLGIGDPTVDLHGAWELFEPDARAAFRSRLDVDDATWLRAKAWALAIALMTFSYYWQTMPGRIESRLVMARAVLADED